MYHDNDECKICRRPVGREDTGNYSQCVACDSSVCERCCTDFSEAIVEIDGREYCADCQSLPRIDDIRQYLRSGEHCVMSRDRRDKRWFGVRRCIEPDGMIRGWLLAHDYKVWACETPLEVEKAIQEMF